MNTLTGQKQWEIEATEMAWWVRTRAALAESPVSVPSTHMEVYNHL